MSSLVSYEYFNQIVGSGATGFTEDGGMYITLVNKTGTSSVRGTVVSISLDYSGSVAIAPANSITSIGIIVESGIADGSSVKVAVSGKAYVLLKNNESASEGYWCGVSDTNGRIYQLSTTPTTTADQNKQIGYSLESVTAGTDKLCLVNLIFR